MDETETLRSTLSHLDARTREHTLTGRALRTTSNAVCVDGAWVQLTAAQRVRLQHLAHAPKLVRIRVRDGRAVRVAPSDRAAPRLTELLTAVERVCTPTRWETVLGTLQHGVLHLRLVDTSAPRSLHARRPNETGHDALHLRYDEDLGTLHIDFLVRRDRDGSAAGASSGQRRAVNGHRWSHSLDHAEHAVREGVDHVGREGAELACRMRAASEAPMTLAQVCRAVECTPLEALLVTAAAPPLESATQFDWGTRFALAARRICDLEVRLAAEQAVVETLMHPSVGCSSAGVAPALW